MVESGGALVGYRLCDSVITIIEMNLSCTNY